MGPGVVVIGSGNVATHLARALAGRCRILQVCSRDIAHARRLADDLEKTSGQSPEAIADTAAVRADADYYLISVSDDAIASIASSMPQVDGIVMHTSGSVPMEAVGRFARHGVFYPLQTFSRDREVDVSQVPFFTEASDIDTHSRIDTLASQIGGSVRHASSADRCVLHIAAVFACNFANHLWACADTILASAGYPLEVLKPLLEVTLAKALAGHPAQVQTGPAARGDTQVMERHMQTLPADKAEIYRMFSASIMRAANISGQSGE